jgi:hypothetical protein
MANKYMKKCSISLTRKEIHIKKISRFSLSQNAIIKKTRRIRNMAQMVEYKALSSNLSTSKEDKRKNSENKQQMLMRMLEERSPDTLLVRMLVQPLWESVWKFLKKLKVELLHDSTINTLGYICKGMKVSIQSVCAPVFMLVPFMRAKL